MRIGIDVRTLETGHRLRGIGAYASNLIRALPRVTHPNEYVFLTQQTPSAASELLARTKDMHFGDMLIRRAVDPTKYNWYRDQWDVPMAVSRARLDALFILDQLSCPYWRTVPTVVTVHDLIQISSLSHSQWKYQLKLAPVRRADAVIAISQAVKRDIIEQLHIAEDRITVVYNGYNEHVFQPAHSLPAVATFRKKLLGNRADNYLLYIGSYREHEPRKNLNFLLEVFCEFAKTDIGRTTALVMVGAPGPEADRLRQLAPPSIRDRVQFTGHVAHDELAPYYHAASAFLFPSLLEGFGLPPLEAMAAGCSVIAANTTSLPEVVGDGGVLLDPTDKVAWVRALTEAMTGGCAVDAQRRRGFAQALKFSWDTCARESIAVAERVAREAI